MYSCERCGYITEYKSNLKNHFKRKRECPPLHSSLSIEVLKLKINQKIIQPNFKKKLIKIDSKMTPIDSKMTPIDSKMTPIDSSLKLIDSKMTPIDSKMTPIDSSSKLIDSKMTPIDSSLKLINYDMAQIDSFSNFNLKSIDSDMIQQIDSDMIQPIDSFSNLNKKHQCKYCKKCYSKNSNLHRHIKKCKAKKNIGDTTVSVDFMSNQIKLLKEEHNKREALMHKGLLKALEKVGNNNTQNTYIKEQNIILNNYGNENLDYITTNYLKNLLKIPFSAVPKLIKNIHFNPSYPENKNIKITNKKLPYASVFKNNKWQIRDKREVIENMVDKGFNILDMQFEKEKEELQNTKYSKYKIFQQKFEDENKELKKQLSKDTVLTILNSK